MTSFEILLGGSPIVNFASERLPTVRDVLRFYTQYWKMKGSESKREDLVARELICFYRNRNIVIMSQKGIMNKIGKIVKELKAIVRSKPSSRSFIRETAFRSKLSSIFKIAVKANHQVNETVADIDDLDTTFEMEQEPSSLGTCFLSIFDGTNVIFLIFVIQESVDISQNIEISSNEDGESTSDNDEYHVIGNQSKQILKRYES